MRNALAAIALALLSAPIYSAKPVTDVPLPSAEDYTVLRGKVTIGTINPYLIGVVVEEPQEAGQTAKYHHIFRLQTTRAIQPFRVVSASASVEFRGNELDILAADRELFYVLMLEEEDAGAHRSLTMKSTRYVGFGLNHEIRPVATKPAGGHRRAVGLDFVDCDITTCLFYEDYGSLGGGGASCTAGGPNATSCTTGNPYGTCTIACSGRSYACCSAATADHNAYCSCIATP